MLKFEHKEEITVWLNQLKDYYAEHRDIPTYSYMAGMFGLKSKSPVHKFVKLMKTHEQLDIGPDNQIIPGKRFFDIPYTDDTVQAGAFTESYAQTGGYMTVLDILIKKPSITRIRPIKGNSMNKLGILDGDMAIYEQRKNANVGDIVIAMLLDSNEVTIKELGKENGQYVLIPHNDNFEIIRNTPFRIEGVLKTTFRTY